MILRGCCWNTKLAQLVPAVQLLGIKEVVFECVSLQKEFTVYCVVIVKTFVSWGCKVPCQALC